MAEIHRLEVLHKRNPLSDTLTTLTEARALLKSLTLNDTLKVLMWLNQKYYEKNNKADTMLARCLKQRIESKQISQIRMITGRTTNSSERVEE
ncbi:Hypothetical predicted protein, partial [Pelobates cultripes]